MGAEQPVTAGTPVRGYTLVLPPGWHRVPVRRGSAEAIRATVAEALKAVPPEVPRDRVAPYRAELEGKLRAMVTKARGNGAVDLYLPIGPMHGVPIGASFIVSEGSIDYGGQDADPAQIVAFLATEDGGAGSAVTVDGGPAARIEHVEPPEPAAEVDLGSRRVDYMIPMPGERNRWLLSVFTTMGAGSPDDELSGILVQLFDAIMSTFRWTHGSDTQ